MNSYLFVSLLKLGGKISTVLLAMVFIRANVSTSFAANASICIASEEAQISQEDVMNLSEKYGLEVESLSSIDDKFQKIFFYGDLDELETLISESGNNKIEVEDRYVFLTPITKSSGSSRLSSSLASTGLDSLSEEVDIYDDLTIKCSVAGKYKTSGSATLWTEVTKSNVEEWDSSVYAKVASVDKNSATVENAGKYIKHSYEISVDKYLAVPIKGGVKLLKLGTDDINGKVYFYANKISL